MKVNVTNNKKSIILKNLAIKTNHYVVIFEIIQLINNNKRVREVHKTTIYFINKVIVRELTTSQYAFDNEISKIKDIKKKKHKLKKKKRFKKQEKLSIKKIKKKNFKKRFEKKFK